jgi:hypothetical protein
MPNSVAEHIIVGASAGSPGLSFISWMNRCVVCGLGCRDLFSSYFQVVIVIMSFMVAVVHK